MPKYLHQLRGWCRIAPSRRIVWRRQGAVALGVFLALTPTACGQDAVQSESRNAGASVESAKAADGPTFAELSWRVHVQGAAAVKKQYGADWPSPAPHTAGSAAITCSATPPVEGSARRVEELKKQFGDEISAVASGAGTADWNLLQRMISGKQAYKAGRTLQELCDGTVVWLETGSDIDFEVKAPYDAFDAPSGGNRVGSFDPAHPNELGD